MNSRSPLRVLAGGLCAIPLVLSLPASAQDEDLATLAENAFNALKQEKWEEALAYSTKAVEMHGRNQPLVTHGPKFGKILYWKGLCELKLRKWPEAMTSFEACYKDFPNPAGNRENTFNKMALLKWGEAAMGEEDWELALKQFKKFLEERDKELDKYPQGPFHIGMAICHYRLGRIPEGSEHLEIAIKNKNTFPTPDAGIITGFQELILACIAKRNEQAAIDFITKYRGEIIIAPYLMQQYARVFMKVAGDAVAADMDRTAFALYQLIPTTESAIDDMRARLKSLGPLKGVTDGANTLVRAKLEADLAALDSDRRGKSSAEMVRLAATAYLHEKNGNVHGAYQAYFLLETFHPTSERREDNLFNLVRTSSIVGGVADTQRFAETFEKMFPDSKRIPDVRRLKLSVLFYDRKYDECIEVAAPLLAKLEPGTQQHDIALHVLGGSYFYTGRHQEAQPLLDEHVEKYPKSPFAMPAAYLRAANLSRMRNWSKAASLLDEFLKTYPDPSQNIYMPFALYDRANCDFSEDKPELALERITTIVKDFPKSNVLDQAYLLRGNIEYSLENPDRAEQAFLKALEAAEERGHKVTAADALYSLVTMLAQPGNPRIKDAVPHADRYWKEFSEGSPFNTRLAVAQFPALEAVDRAEDGLSRLRDVIAATAGNPEAVGLEPLINSYTEFYLTKHTPEELKEHYYNFPGIRSSDSAARALLRVALIRVFEDVIKKAKDEPAKVAGSAAIKMLFQELKTDFVLKDLSNSILVKVGDYLRANTATPREALPYYDEAIGREDQAKRFNALIGRGEVYASSGVPAGIDKALADFEAVYKESGEKPDKEIALYRIIELLVAQKEYAKAAEQARVYLDREKTGFSKYSAQVGLLLARTFEERKMADDAIAMYVKVWATHMGNIRISAPAMKSWMELLWSRNKSSADPKVPADRQGAYEGGARYIENTAPIKGKMAEDDLKLWEEVEKLVKTYEADPNIKSMAKIKAEKEANKKIRLR
jgi:tetratricopeptide (TPR) repeat protein